MRDSNVMSLFKITINKKYKDLFLNTLAGIKTAHIKARSEKLRMASKEAEDPRKERLKILRQNLNELFRKLEINEQDFQDLKNKKFEKINFVVKDSIDLINDLIEEVNFNNNRLDELETYISTTKIELEKINNINEGYQFLAKFNFSRDSLSKFKYLNFKVFTTFSKNINDLKVILDFNEFPSVIQMESISNERTVFFIIYPRDLEENLKERTGIIHAEPLPILKRFLTPDGINFKKILREKELIEDTLSRYEKELKRMREDNLIKYAAINEVVNNLEEYYWAETQFEDLSLNRLSYQFFIPKARKEEVIQKLVYDFNEKITIETVDIDKRGHIEKERVFEKKIEKERQLENNFEEKKKKKFNEEDDLRKETPTMMMHNRIIRPFETLTRMYGTPSYSEIDPTPFLFISFPLLFGFMFGDIGHGLVLVIAGLVGSKVFKERGGDTYNFCWIIFWCGLWAMLFGYLYGEFFGTEEILFYPLHPVIISLPIIGSFTLHSPLNNIITIFILTIIIGVIHINLGWLLQFINFWKDSKKYKAFSESLLKILFLDGGIILIFVWGFNFSAWLAPPFPPILLVVLPGLFLVIGKPLGKVLRVSYLKEESYGNLLGEGSMETFETVLSVPSNVLSYIRLLALLLAHISLMIAIRAIIGLIPGQTLWYVQVIIIIGLILGNIVVILLEGILVFLNAIRLNFYEFFFKFYEGKGTEFMPFILESNFSSITISIVSAKDIVSKEIEKEIETEKTKEEIDKARSSITKKFFK